jgi:hypothetical protein
VNPEEKMKDDALQAREWFPGEMKQWAEKSEKQVNVMGRAAYEQHTGEEMPPGRISHSQDEFTGWTKRLTNPRS